MDDDVKTTSTKSYDTHEDGKSSKFNYNNKKTYVPIVELGKASNDRKSKNSFNFESKY